MLAELGFQTAQLPVIHNPSRVGQECRGFATERRCCTIQFGGIPLAAIIDTVEDGLAEEVDGRSQRRRIEGLLYRGRCLPLGCWCWPWGSADGGDSRDLSDPDDGRAVLGHQIGSDRKDGHGSERDPEPPGDSDPGAEAQTHVRGHNRCSIPRPQSAHEPRTKCCLYQRKYADRWFYKSRARPQILERGRAGPDQPRRKVGGIL